MNEPPRRRSLRLKDYDYATPGAYFVTIVTARRQMLFEDSRTCDVVRGAWDAIPGHYVDAVDVDTFVVMPNHVHGLIWIEEADRRVQLATIVGLFKSGATRELRSKGLVAGDVWQAGYHEHVVRNEAALARIRTYINENPARWAHDPENPGGAVDVAEAEFRSAIALERMEPGGLRRSR